MRFRNARRDSIYVVLSMVGVLPGLWALPPKAPLKFAVRTYNYGQVSGPVLRDAEQYAAGILRRTGLAPVWVDCPSSPEEIDSFPVCNQLTGEPVAGTLKILSETMAARYGLPRTRLGLTIQDHASFIFYGRVQRVCNDADLPEPAVLGCVIAHELGHLLLGAGAHSKAGIMMKDLGVNNFRQAASGRPLLFSPEQTIRLRARLQERIRIAATKR